MGNTNNWPFHSINIQLRNSSWRVSALGIKPGNSQLSSPISQLSSRIKITLNVKTTPFLCGLNSTVHFLFKMLLGFYWMQILKSPQIPLHLFQTFDKGGTKSSIFINEIIISIHLTLFISNIYQSDWYWYCDIQCHNDIPRT